MTNANIEFAWPRTRFKHVKTSLLHVLLTRAPWLVDRTVVYLLTERLIEYPFIHENIPFAGKGRILDVGSGSSVLPLELASKGYQVWAIDLIRGYHRSIRHVNFVFVQGDITKTAFIDDFFDTVTAVSSIEHVGYWGSKTNPGGDKDACREILRILKPGGKFLLTLPFGKEGTALFKERAWARVYDLPSLKELLEGFEITKMEFGLLEGASWRPASLEEAKDIDPLSQPKWYSSRAVVGIIARK